MRVYSFNGVEYPSVTTVLGLLDKPALVPWAARMAAQYVKDNYSKGCDVIQLANDAAVNFREISKEACDIGTEVHDAIEAHIKHGNPFLFSTSPEVESAMHAFFEWEKENIQDWLEVEVAVVDEETGFAGRLDIIALMKDGRTLLIDFKTSKAVYDSMIQQLGAYKKARESMKGVYNFNGEEIEYKPIKIDGIAVLRLDKETGMSEFVDCTKKQERATDSFCKLVDYYYSEKKRILKNNPKVK